MIEVVCVIAIMGMCMTIPLNYFGGFQRIENKRFIENFYQDTLSVRNASICGNDSYLIFTEKEYRIYIDGKIDRQRHCPSQLQLSTNMLQRMIAFNNYGTPSYAGTIDFKTEKEKLSRLTIVPYTGRISLIL